MSCEAQQVSLREREQHYQLVTGRPYLVYRCPLLFPVSCDSSLIEVLFLASSRDYYPHAHTLAQISPLRPQTVFSEDNLQSSLRRLLVVGGVTERGRSPSTATRWNTDHTHREDDSCCCLTLPLAGSNSSC